MFIKSILNLVTGVNCYLPATYNNMDGSSLNSYFNEFLGESPDKVTLIKNNKYIFLNFLGTDRVKENSSYLLFDNFVGENLIFMKTPIFNMDDKVEKKEIFNDLKTQLVSSFTDVTIDQAKLKAYREAIISSYSRIEENVFQNKVSEVLDCKEEEAEEDSEEEIETEETIDFEGYDALKQIFYEKDIYFNLNNREVQKYEEDFVLFFMRRFEYFLDNVFDVKSEIYKKLNGQTVIREVIKKKYLLLNLPKEYNLNTYGSMEEIFNYILTTPSISDTVKSFLELLDTEVKEYYAEQKTKTSSKIESLSSFDTYTGLLNHTLKCCKSIVDTQVKNNTDYFGSGPISSFSIVNVPLDEQDIQKRIVVVPIEDAALDKATLMKRIE